MGIGIIWNPWHGCVKYSEGCEHCYMYYLDSKHDRDGGDIYRVKSGFSLPLKRDRKGNFKIPDGAEVNVCLTSDFFLEQADSWRAEVWDIIRSRPGVHFSILTKRAERIEANLPPDWGDGWDNVALRVTAENQRRANERIPILLKIPAKSKGVMIAPILSAVDISRYLEAGQIDTVLADGENYDGTRPCRYEWIKSLSDQCRKYSVPFTFCGTGNVFVKDGQTYHICKAYQHIQAVRSGLSYPPPKNIPKIQTRCKSCKRRHSCNGCDGCGDCG